MSLYARCQGRTSCEYAKRARSAQHHVCQPLFQRLLPSKPRSLWPASSSPLATPFCAAQSLSECSATLGHPFKWNEDVRLVKVSNFALPEAGQTFVPEPSGQQCQEPTHQGFSVHGDFAGFCEELASPRKTVEEKMILAAYEERFPIASLQGSPKPGKQIEFEQRGKDENHVLVFVCGHSRCFHRAMDAIFR